MVDEVLYGSQYFLLLCRKQPTVSHNFSCVDLSLEPTEEPIIAPHSSVGHTHVTSYTYVQYHCVVTHAASVALACYCCIPDRNKVCGL